MIPSVPQTGSFSRLDGGQDLGQFDDTALLSLPFTAAAIKAGWVPGKSTAINYLVSFRSARFAKVKAVVISFRKLRIFKSSITCPEPLTFKHRN